LIKISSQLFWLKNGSKLLKEGKTNSTSKTYLPSYVTNFHIHNFFWTCLNLIDKMMKPCFVFKVHNKYVYTLEFCWCQSWYVDIIQIFDLGFCPDLRAFTEAWAEIPTKVILNHIICPCQKCQAWHICNSIRKGYNDTPYHCNKDWVLEDRIFLDENKVDHVFGCVVVVEAGLESCPLHNHNQKEILGHPFDHHMVVLW